MTEPKPIFKAKYIETMEDIPAGSILITQSRKLIVIFIELLLIGAIFILTIINIRDDNVFQAIWNILVIVLLAVGIVSNLSTFYRKE